jgi:hypothetical protein
MINKVNPMPVICCKIQFYFKTYMRKDNAGEP